MSYSDTIFNHLTSPILTLAVLSAVAYFFRDIIFHAISTRVNKAATSEINRVQHQLDLQLREVSAKLERDKGRDELLLQTLLNTSSGRVVELNKREIAAAEAVWDSISKLDGLTVALQFSEILDFEEIVASDKMEQEKFSEIAKMVTQNFPDNFSDKVNVIWTRLYLSEKAWALYSAYSIIILTGALKMKALAFGLPNIGMADVKEIRKSVVKALPHQEALFEKFPNPYNSLFLSELKSALVEELQKTIRGESASSKDITAAREILAAVEAQRKDEVRTNE